VTCSDATWLRWRAHVESGCSGPTGGQSTCCQVQVLEHSPQGGEGIGLGYGTKLSGYTDLRSHSERAPLPWTRLLAIVVSGLRRSGHRSGLKRPWRAVSIGAGHRSGLGRPWRAVSADRGERSPPERATGVELGDRGERSPPERAIGVDLSCCH